VADDSPWVKEIIALLGAAEGHREKRIEVLGEARRMDRTLPAAGAFADAARHHFKAWVEGRGYLKAVPSALSLLPFSATMSNEDVQSKFGLVSAKAIAEKQEQLSVAREARIKNFVEAARIHSPTDCISKVAAQDEYETGMRQLEAEQAIRNARYQPGE
jgi:hypothetical protein